MLCGDKSHVASYKNICPKCVEETNVNKIVTLKKRSRSEVTKQLVTNRFDLLRDYDGSFPETFQRKQNQSKDVNKEVNKILTKKSYSIVLKIKPAYCKP